jgi:hypothetical protein
MTTKPEAPTLTRVQQRIALILNAENAQASQRNFHMANGYLLALRDEGLIDASVFAELDEQVFEATGEWIANSLVADGDLVIGPDGEKYWA